MDGPRQGKGLAVVTSNAAEGVHANLNQAAHVGERVGPNRLSQAMHAATGAAIKAASSASLFVDKYA